MYNDKKLDESKTISST